jgi:hypothetical protein
MRGGEGRSMMEMEGEEFVGWGKKSGVEWWEDGRKREWMGWGVGAAVERGGGGEVE